MRYLHLAAAACLFSQPIMAMAQESVVQCEESGSRSFFENGSTLFRLYAAHIDRWDRTTGRWVSACAGITVFRTWYRFVSCTVTPRAAEIRWASEQTGGWIDGLQTLYRRQVFRIDRTNATAIMVTDLWFDNHLRPDRIEQRGTCVRTADPANAAPVF